MFTSGSKLTSPFVFLLEGVCRTYGMEEKQLIKACQQNKVGAFRTLYDRYGSVLFGICLRYAGNEQEAQDILQEALIKIFNKVGSFRSEGSFEGWLKRLVTNTAINHVKKSYRIKESGQPEDLVTLEDTGLSAIDHLSSQELIEIINKLPEGYRLVFNMYIIEGYDHREIAKELGISEGTSRSQLVKAKRKLQEALISNGYIKHERA